MRAWDRTRVATLCGGCGRTLAPGDPVLVMTIPRGPRAPLRCVRCVTCEGPAPPDLPAYTPPDNTIRPRPLTRIAPLLPLGTPLAEWQRRAAGEREPGEEG